MYLQEILEVALGMVFLWLILSVTAMTLQEWIGSVFAWRARALKRSIRRMLTTKELTNRFYSHSLITSLSQTETSTSSKAKVRLPSYIPADKFASTVFDIVTQTAKETTPLTSFTLDVNDQLSSIKSREQRKLAKEGWTMLLETAKQVAASGLSQAAVDSLKVQLQAYREKYPEVQPVIDEAMPGVDAFYQKYVERQTVSDQSTANANLSMRLFRLGLAIIEGKAPKFKETVSALLASADVYGLEGEKAVTKVHSSLESWFNDAMDRLSGSYKRRAQFVSFALGLMLAATLNVDSIYVATSLWREPTLRQAIIVQAQTYVEANPQLADATTAVSTSDPLESIPEIQQLLRSVNLPFGWTTEVVDTAGKQCTLVPYKSTQMWGITAQNELGQSVCKRFSNLPLSLNSWLIKLLGFFITSLATAQGAPFWFDILKKLVNIRSTGSTPAEQSAVG